MGGHKEVPPGSGAGRKLDLLGKSSAMGHPLQSALCRCQLIAGTLPLVSLLKTLCITAVLPALKSCS